MKKIFYFLLFFASANTLAQDCKTSGASIQNVFTNNDGRYILVNDDEEFPGAYRKVFDAATGQLLYKYPQQDAAKHLEKLGFTEATMNGFTGKNDSFFYIWCHGLDINYTNKKHFQNTGAAIEQFNFDSYYKSWNYRFTWPVDGAAAKTFEGFLIDGYYNLADNIGLLRVVAKNKKSGDYVTTCYKLVKGQEPAKVSRSADFEINFMNMERITRNSMIYLPKHKQIISSFYGAVYDFEKNKVIEKSIFRVKNGYLGASLKGAVVNEEETAIMLATYGGVTILDLQNYKVLAEFKSGSSSDKDIRLPVSGFKNHVLVLAYGSNIFLIKEGKETVLCDPKAGDDEKGYDTWLVAEQKKRKGSYTPVNDENAVTYESTVKAYNELLRDLANSDSRLNPLLQKIMNSGKDAWILYKSREEAHKLLMRQADSIREFIKKYKAFITQNTLDSLYARLATTEEANAKF